MVEQLVALIDLGWTYSPVVNKTVDGMSEVYGVVVHIMDGTFDGSKSWFNNPTAQASAHFGTRKDGYAEQWVDTKDKAWAEMAGNGNYISVENEAVSGESLTDGQISRVAEVLSWAHRAYGVPLQLANAPGDRGLGWHGMGGAAWGGHFDCPGDAVKAQFNEIIRRAGGGTVTPAPAPSPVPVPKAPDFPGEYLKLQSPMLHDGNVSVWQRKMAERMWSITIDGWYGPHSRDICEQFQAEKGLTVDGIVGPITWNATWSAPVTS
jgi:peptidoglycan hydrolase-like protein with peptidoglycan-binding domain